MQYAFPKLEDIRACVFDAYGTLFDVGSVANSVRDELSATGTDWKAFADLWRDKQLQYTWLRGLAGHHADFWQVTGDALDFAMENFSINDVPMRERLMNLYLRISAYPETAQTLRLLKDANIKLGILSNGTPEMLHAAATNAGIADYFDAILSIEEAGVYKPHPSVYRLATRHLEIPPTNICFISSNGWDAWSAKAFGYRVLWCNRFSQPPERIPAPPDGTILNLSELPGCLGC